MLPEKLPFYFKANNAKGNGGLAEVLPFHVHFDNELKMYRQQASDILKEILKKVYELGSLVDGSISNESGAVYINQISAFIEGQMLERTSLKLLEIGCGNGVILKALKKTGANIIGLEPGDHGTIDGIDETEIIHDFFPSAKITQKFGLIYSLLVLEHIEDPVDFLKLQGKYLEEDGTLIFGVPNCEPFLKTGDISIFIHEHYSYFTKESIYYTIHQAGFQLVKVQIIEGIIMAAAKKGKENSGSLLNTFEIIAPINFETKIDQLNEKIIRLFDNYEENKIAVYVPGRAINTLYLAGKINCRLVDDNSEIHGKYLPAFSNPIESFQEIAANPPQLIFIYSRTFGERIKTKCSEESKLASAKIVTLNDLD